MEDALAQPHHVVALPVASTAGAALVVAIPTVVMDGTGEITHARNRLILAACLSRMSR